MIKLNRQGFTACFEKGKKNLYDPLHSTESIREKMVLHGTNALLTCWYTPYKFPIKIIPLCSLIKLALGPKWMKLETGIFAKIRVLYIYNTWCCDDQNPRKFN